MGCRLGPVRAVELDRQRLVAGPRTYLPPISATHSRRTQQPQHERTHTVRVQRAHRSRLACRAAPCSAPLPAPKKLNLQTATDALFKAQEAWTKYDVDKSGTLTLAEAVQLLNSPEMHNAMLTLTNVQPLPKTEAEVRDLFNEADANKDGVLTRKEFMALFMALVRRRVQASPVVLAEALLGFLDQDRNGKIDGSELAVLLAVLGFPAALLLPIPKAVGVDYRSLLRAWGSKKDAAT